MSQEEDFFSKVSIPFKQDKADIWEHLSSQLDGDNEVDKTPAKTVRLFNFKLAAAASFAILVAAISFMKLYTQQIVCEPGQHLAHVLPDGSKIQLNAASSISYQPFWWKLERALDFEGEAFFEVQKGSNFAVISKAGKTEVLGTSFNISTRNNGYKVYCATGKVRVSSSDEKLELSPGMQCKLDEKLFTKNNVNSSEILFWTKGKLYFKSMPINLVFAELERQYGIKINHNLNISEYKGYSGSYLKPNQVEDVFDLLSADFGFTFVKENDQTYKVIKS